MGVIRGACAFVLFVSISLTAGCGGGDGTDPVVFAHGCSPPPFDNETSVTLWEPMVDYFRDQEYPEEYLNVFRVSGEATCPSRTVYAADLAEYVSEVLEATGKKRVDIVSFSLGAVGSRLYVREGGDEYVRDFVSIAGGNHGSDFASMADQWQEQYGEPYFEGAKEAYPKYACEGESTEADIQFFLNGCLTEDGRTVEEDETPFGVEDGGKIRYLALYNPNDEVVLPPTSACLNQEFIDDCSDEVNLEVDVPPGAMWPAHVETSRVPEVSDLVVRFVGGEDVN